MVKRKNSTGKSTTLNDSLDNNENRTTALSDKCGLQKMSRHQKQNIKNVKNKAPLVENQKPKKDKKNWQRNQSKQAAISPNLVEGTKQQKVYEMMTRNAKIRAAELELAQKPMLSKSANRTNLSLRSNTEDLKTTQHAKANVSKELQSDNKKTKLRNKMTAAARDPEQIAQNEPVVSKATKAKKRSAQHAELAVTEEVKLPKQFKNVKSKERHNVDESTLRTGLSEFLPVSQAAQKQLKNNQNAKKEDAKGNTTDFSKNDKAKQNTKQEKSGANEQPKTKMFSTKKRNTKSQTSKSQQKEQHIPYDNREEAAASEEDSESGEEHNLSMSASNGQLIKCFQNQSSSDDSSYCPYERDCTSSDVSSSDYSTSFWGDSDCSSVSFNFDESSSTDRSYSPSQSDCISSESDSLFSISDAFGSRESVETVLIKNGAAVKYQLESNEQADFDSDDSTFQIVELKEATPPMAVLNKTLNDVETAADGRGSDSEECPLLVAAPLVVNRDEDDDSSSGSWASSQSFTTESSDSEMPEMPAEIVHDDSPNDGDEICNFLKAKLFDASCERVEQEEELLPSHKLTNHFDNSIASDSSILDVVDYGNFSEDNVQINPPTATQPIPIPETTPTYTTPNESTTLMNSSRPSSRMSLRSIFCESLCERSVLVLLKEPLYIYGALRLRVVVNQVEANGWLATDEDEAEVEIYSPRGCSQICIAPKASGGTDVDKKHALQAQLKTMERQFVHAAVRAIIDQFEPQKDAVILLKRNIRATRIAEFFKLHLSENVFPSSNTMSVKRSHHRSEAVLRCLLNGESMRPLRVPEEWNCLELQANTRMVLAGGKGVGKSTMLRYLLNRHLRQLGQLLIIDLDIGQPELFVPHTISCTVMKQPLIGPGWFLNHQPDKVFVIGETNITNCFPTYLHAVKKLLEYCGEHFREMAWLVNTMGYNKGLGPALMAAICELLRPTDIVQINGKRAINNFDPPLRPDVMECDLPFMYDFLQLPSPTYKAEHKLHAVRSAVAEVGRQRQAWSMTSADMRYVMMLARLSEALLPSEAENKPVINIPYTSLSMVSRLSFESQTHIELRDLSAYLNACVFLGRCSDDKALVECFGIGVLSSYDEDIVQFNSSLPVDCIDAINCVCISELPLPASLVKYVTADAVCAPPFVYNTVADESSRNVKQFHYRPAEFLSGMRRQDDEPRPNT